MCCGLGRHSDPLSQAGYEVLGIDRDEKLLEEARATGSAARFLQWDMRRLSELNRAFDAVICMWQSFGYFEPSENQRVLESMAERLRPGGRLVLDPYNGKYYEAMQISEGSELRTYNSTDWMESWHYDRQSGILEVHLVWASEDEDHFKWQLFSPQELTAMGESFGLVEVLTCADFTPKREPDKRHKGFQIVFQRTI